jgi:Gas vesicle synthesis protein GvpL/GvpF
MSLWYVYCLGDEVTPEMVEGSRGLDGEPLGLVGREGLLAVVSSFSSARVAVTPENALTHNRVNAALLARSTPLPFRFGTLVTEERLLDFIKSREAALREALRHVRGCVEMSVKIIWDLESERREAEGPEPSEDSAAADTAASAEGARSGTAFLMSKRREILGGEALKERAEALAGWFGGRLSDLARDSRVTVNPSGALVVRAAHLVERGRVEEYRARVQMMGVERAGALRFLTSGPWPPYSFGDARP